MCLLSVALDSSNRDSWGDILVVVYLNAIKDAINLQATLAFARRTGQQVYWYCAIDTYKGLPINNDAVIELLDMLPSNKTGGCVGALPLVLGMPVVITENFDVQGRVVTGAPALSTTSATVLMMEVRGTSPLALSNSLTPQGTHSHTCRPNTSPSFPTKSR
jgi:hypothetical protein